MNNLFNELQRFGFSKYECQVYVGLLKNSPITGYEVSKRTGVPRSMIYQVLGKLLDKGAIFTIPSDPVKYIPLPAKDLIDRLRKDYEQSFDYLEQELTSLDTEQEADIIWRVKSDELVLKEIIELIERTEEELWLSVWEPQVSVIKEVVDERVENGVKAFSVLFGAPETEIGLTYHHNYMALEIAKERTDGHLTIIARDNEEVLIANFSPNTEAWAVKTKDPALVLVATEYIRHDIMYGEITKAFGSEKVDQLWQSNIDLTHIVTGKRFKYK